MPCVTTRDEAPAAAPPDPDRARIRQLTEQTGIPPERTAEMVLQAIKDNQFYILTHTDYDEVIRERMETHPQEHRTPTRRAPASRRCAHAARCSNRVYFGRPREGRNEAQYRRILTTHAGSLPRPDDLIELYRNDAPDGELLPRLRSAVGEVVRSRRGRRRLVNDGEFGKSSWGARLRRVVVLRLRAHRASRSADDPAARSTARQQQGPRVFNEFYERAPMSGGQSGGGTQNTATARLAQLSAPGR